MAASIGSQSPPNAVIETFVLLSDVGGAGEQIARSVVAHRGVGERWQLPGERLLSGLGFEVSEGTQDGWSLAGYDEAAVDAVAGQLSSLSELLESVDEAPLNLGIWLDLAAAQGALDGVVGTLTALPLPATEQIRLWTMAATIPGLSRPVGISEPADRGPATPSRHAAREAEAPIDRSGRIP